MSMFMVKKAKVRSVERSLAKGLLAGLIGGIIATAAKTAAERMFPPRAASGEAGNALQPVASAAQAQAIHLGVGVAVGAAYGALVEYFPAATAKNGATFGAALGTLTHEGSLPALGIPAKLRNETLGEQAGEMTSFLVYGVVTETVRGFVRRFL
jgi:putative membrane protein